jgi:hypothetical protein
VAGNCVQPQVGQDGPARGRRPSASAGSAKYLELFEAEDDRQRELIRVPGPNTDTAAGRFFVGAKVGIQAFEERTSREKLLDCSLLLCMMRYTLHAQRNLERQLGGLGADQAHPRQQLKLGAANGEAIIAGQPTVAEVR